ncbi:MAG: hypothetical protein N3B18_03165 [Desulfobacterota bacterium]|nr:hypothetical protein [Thermodesulfobacteriota bacterium]
MGSLRNNNRQTYRYSSSSASRRLAVLILAVLCWACGKKADPGLPVLRAPDAPRSFHAIARAEGIMLRWRAPERNMDETPLLDLAGFTILRAEIPLADACRACPREYRELFDYPYKGPLGQLPDRRFYLYQDTALTPKRLYTYTIRCYNEREQRGKMAHPIDIAWDVPPSPPAGLHCERTNRLLRITWSPVTTLSDGSPCTELAGYTVYRTTSRGFYDDRPLTEEPVRDPVLEDVPEKLNMTYFYTVRAVRRVEQTLIESLPSPEIEVAYLDLQPPNVPEGLTAIPIQEGILLKWIPKLEQDVAGINIYRSTHRGGEFVKINEQPITENTWIDRSVKSGMRYVYAITAVDRSPQANESALSEPVEVIYRTQ